MCPTESPWSGIRPGRFRRRAETAPRPRSRHCEEPLRRSNPVFACGPLDCFAPLAMTWMGFAIAVPPAIEARCLHGAPA
ncbi:MAG: hypothetical protein EON84_16605 [Bradyrhizobiaceae bacterium]|nr:MAG: hypothetical protein EON84_16605 [Bradyrhizobiaceae bacterium]